jgi:integration host factor subunit beta
MDNVTKKQLVDRAAFKAGLSQEDTKLAVEEFLKAVEESLIDGNRIEIRNFGRFSVKYQEEHSARNPLNGKNVMVPGRYKPCFLFSVKLRERLNDAMNR